MDRYSAFECCQNCEERVPACHAACEQYIEARQYVDRMRQAGKDNGALDVLIEARMRARRRHGKK